MWGPSGICIATSILSVLIIASYRAEKELDMNSLILIIFASVLLSQVTCKLLAEKKLLKEAEVCMSEETLILSNLSTFSA